MCPLSGRTSALQEVFSDSTLYVLNLIRMEWLREPIIHSWKESSLSSMSQNFLAFSGGMHWLHLFMYTIALPHLLIVTLPLHLSSGTSNNLLLLIFAFLAVLPVSTSRRTSDSNWLPTHRSVYSSATLLITRPGCSGIQ